MRQIGPYQLLDLLGKGGMGEVYLAEDTRLGRKVALKLLPPELTNDELGVLRFQQEARTASALNHPNILTIFDIGEVESTHFIATEFVKGETLRACMSATRMNVEKTLNIVIQVASALGAAHEVGVVHRDIKPENIMVRPDGLVKVLDFGIAKLTQRTAMGGSSEMGLVPLVNTEPGMIMGTPKYMSPEQVRAFDVDERTDIFSLGVVLYEMITGIAPFERRTIGDTIAAILQAEPPPMTEFATAVPSGLQAIVARALRKDRDERYTSMGDLISELKSAGKEIEIDHQSISPINRGDAPTIVTALGDPIGETRPEITARSSAMSATHTSSSAEYIVSEIKQHKRSAAVVLALLLAAGAGVVYLLFSARSSKAAIKTVAILPFVNASNNPDMEYLSDGISDSLINSLSQLPQLRVSAQYSSFKYRGKEVDLQAVSKALGVQAIVTGTVMQVGEVLQVSANLADMRDNTQMWGEKYARRKPDLLVVQSEISQKIAEKLRLRLTNAEQQQIAKEANSNPVASDLLLKGRFYGQMATPEGLQKYVDFCNQALVVDPNYALAYAGLADGYRLISFEDPSAAPKAEAAARRALQLDDTLAEVHYALAQIKADAWEWEDAERENKRAIELNPSLAEAHYGYATYLSIMGRHKDAIAEMSLAKELDPFLPKVFLGQGIVYYNARLYDRAIEQYKKALELDPKLLTTHEYLGYAYAMKEMYAEAISEYKETIALTHNDYASAQSYMGYALAMSGKRNEALDILRKLKTTKEHVSFAELAVLYAGLSEKEHALASLEASFADRDLQLQFLKVEPHYDSLRSEPRFITLMRKVGLTP